MKALIVAALVLVPTLSLAETENEALLRIQNRNAAVVGNLVDQTPQYQDGHTLRVEAAKQQERDAAERAQQRQAEVEAARSSGSGGLSREDQARIKNLNSDLQRTATDKRLTRTERETSSRALRDEQRQIYSGAGVASPIAAEPPPRPIVRTEMPKTIHIGNRTLNCAGNHCN